MTKEKLIELRCKAWGITEDEYFINQNGDFTLENMEKAYRRGKNKSRKKITELQDKLKNLASVAEVRLANWQKYEMENKQLREANATLATMNNSMWVELEKKRAESQGITNRLHQLIKAKEIIKRLLCVVRNHLCIADISFNILINDAEKILKEE